VTGRRGRRHKQLLDNFKEMTGYCKLKEDKPDRTLKRTCCERGYGSVITGLMNGVIVTYR